jgi:hypothetical protein
MSLVLERSLAVAEAVLARLNRVPRTADGLILTQLQSPILSFKRNLKYLKSFVRELSLPFRCSKLCLLVVAIELFAGTSTR